MWMVLVMMLMVMRSWDVVIICGVEWVEAADDVVFNGPWADVEAEMMMKKLWKMEVEGWKPREAWWSL